MDKRKKVFTLVVGVFTIIGALATIITIFLNNNDAKSNNNNSGVVNQNSGDVILNENNSGTINQNSGDAYNQQINNTNYILKDDSETLLYQRLKDAVTDDILCFIPDDFDNDGRKEAFAFVGHLTDEGSNSTWDGIPYFISNNIIQKLSSDTRYGYNVDKDYYIKNCREIEMGKNKAVVFTLYYTSNSVDEIYGVKNGTLIQYEIPDTKGGLRVTENFITLSVSSFDALWEEISDNKSGHTWKNYYFFWNDGINNFSEYGGTEISLEQLSRLKDVSNLIKEYVDNGYSIYNILYRANGIININFEKIEPPEINYSSNRESISHFYENVTLHIKYDTKTLHPEEILDRNAGIYLSAINPTIAVYPEFPY